MRSKGISEEEIKKVIWSFNNNKSPRPDDFSMAFFKDCWEIVKEDILKIVEDFHSSGFLELGSNATYIYLIPKKEGAISITNLWSVSLISSPYKIISKFLADRMKMVLDLVISHNQSAFIGGRQSFNDVLIASV